MHRACQTFSFLSKEQIAVCLKNKELHFRIISYSYTKKNPVHDIISLHKIIFFLELGLLIAHPLHNTKK